MTASTNMPADTTEESLRRQLRCHLESRNLAALRQALEVAKQRDFGGAEVENAKQLLNLLATAFPTYDEPLTQPQLHGGSSPLKQPQLPTHSSSGGAVVPTKPQVQTAQGSSGGGVSPTQSQVDAAPAGSSGSPIEPHFQWLARDPGGSTAALMQHAASCLCGSVGIADWKPGFWTPASMQLWPQLKTTPMPDPEMPAAKLADHGKCWCDKKKRMQLDRNGRPWFYKCAKCSKS